MTLLTGITNAARSGRGGAVASPSGPLGAGGFAFAGSPGEGYLPPSRETLVRIQPPPIYGDCRLAVRTLSIYTAILSSRRTDPGPYGLLDPRYHWNGPACARRRAWGNSLSAGNPRASSSPERKRLKASAGRIPLSRSGGGMVDAGPVQGSPQSLPCTGPVPDLGRGQPGHLQVRVLPLLPFSSGLCLGQPGGRRCCQMSGGHPALDHPAGAPLFPWQSL